MTAATGGTESEQLILAQMHTLDYIAAVVEHAPNILRVDGTREVWVTEMPVIPGIARRYFLHSNHDSNHMYLSSDYLHSDMYDA